jgi:spoIIIJ-associated protein
MAESSYEFTGKTVDECVDEGLAQLGLNREQVDIEVLHKGSRGIFGLGSEPARVRLTVRTVNQPAVSTPAAPVARPEPPVSEPTRSSEPLPASSPPVAGGNASDAARTQKRTVSNISSLDDDEQPPVIEGATHVEISNEELEHLAVSLLEDLLHNMGYQAEIATAWRHSDDEDEPYLMLDIHGKDLSPLIGRRGETLASIQYLVRLMVNQRIRQWKTIVVDVDQYKERRVSQLTQLAERMADQVIKSGRAVSLEPMPANERRIVHLALRDHPTVYTQSSGEGERRKVHIVTRP